jgi:hypothetical protein
MKLLGFRYLGRRLIPVFRADMSDDQIARFGDPRCAQVMAALSHNGAFNGN